MAESTLQLFDVAAHILAAVFLEENYVSQGGNGTISVLLSHDQWLANHKNESLSLFNTSFYLFYCSDLGLSLVLSFGKISDKRSY